MTSETDEALIQQVGERALQIYADESNGYARAVTVSTRFAIAAAPATVMRLAAWLAFDCVLPLGPMFIEKILGALDGPLEDLENSRAFKFMSAHCRAASSSSATPSRRTSRTRAGTSKAWCPSTASARRQSSRR